MPRHNGDLVTNIVLRWVIALVIIVGVFYLLIARISVPEWLIILVGTAVGFWFRGEVSQKGE